MSSAACTNCQFIIIAAEKKPNKTLLKKNTGSLLLMFSRYFKKEA
jgi:hypothetical protein